MDGYRFSEETLQILRFSSRKLVKCEHQCLICTNKQQLQRIKQKYEANTITGINTTKKNSK